MDHLPNCASRYTFMAGGVSTDVNQRPDAHEVRPACNCIYGENELRIQEIARLREAIRESPCPKALAATEVFIVYGELRLMCDHCDCWKRDALEGE